MGRPRSPGPYAIPQACARKCPVNRRGNEPLQLSPPAGGSRSPERRAQAASVAFGENSKCKGDPNEARDVEVANSFGLSAVAFDSPLEGGHRHNCQDGCAASMAPDLEVTSKLLHSRPHPRNSNPHAMAIRRGRFRPACRHAAPVVADPHEQNSSEKLGIYPNPGRRPVTVRVG